MNASRNNEAQARTESGPPGLGIAKLWAGLERVREASAAVKAAGMMGKVEKAEALAEISGDLLKQIIIELAAQAAEIEKLKGKA